MSRVQALRCVLVSADRSLAATVSELIARTPGAELTATMAPVRVLAQPPACDVLLVADGPDRTAAEQAADLAAACPHAGIVVLARDPGIETYRSALAAGARAVIDAPPTPSQLVDAIVRAAPAVPATERAGGCLLAVAGAAGGVGTTAVALALARLSGGVLVDLGSGWSRLPLDHAPSGSLLDLGRVGTAVGPALESLIEDAGGLRLLAGPSQRDLTELLPAGVGTALGRELRTHAETAVADLGVVSCDAARELAAAADRLLIVVTGDVRCALAARSLLTSAAGWGVDGDRTVLVVNRCRRSDELSARGVERSAGCRVAARLPDRPRRMHDFAGGRVDLEHWPAGTPLAALRQVLERAA